jgi:hypothetical protein
MPVAQYARLTALAMSGAKSPTSVRVVPLSGCEYDKRSSARIVVHGHRHP